MSQFRGLGALARAYLLQSFRSRTAIFWNVAFPLLWLFLFGFLFFRGQPAALFVPGLFTITIISGAFFGVSYLMVMERENGILRRYRVTPVTATAVVTANAIRAVVTMSLSLLVQSVVAWWVFDFTIAGSLLLTVLCVLLGAAAFVPLGLIVGSIAQDMRTAPAINNLLFFPLVFTTGAAYPFWMLPSWVQVLGRLMPSSYLVEMLQGVILRGEGLRDIAAPVAVLLATTAVGIFLNSWLFRWESDQPLDRRRLLMAVAGLLLLFIVAAFLSPEFGMSVSPLSGS